MGKRNKDKADQEEGTFSGELPRGELKPQLATKREPLSDSMGEVSQSPIETF